MIKEVYQCPICMSLNVSVDISTGNIHCNKCGQENKPEKFNFYEYINKLKEKENEK